LNLLKSQAIKRRYPLIEEYDFKSDMNTEKLDIELKPNTLVRDY